MLASGYLNKLTPRVLQIKHIFKVQEFRIVRRSAYTGWRFTELNASLKCLTTVKRLKPILTFKQYSVLHSSDTDLRPHLALPSRLACRDQEGLLDPDVQQKDSRRVSIRSVHHFQGTGEFVTVTSPHRHKETSNTTKVAVLRPFYSCQKHKYCLANLYLHYLINSNKL